MRFSQLFTKAAKEAPKDELGFNARILRQAGFIDKVAAGVYTYLPLGFRVLKKIEGIIREELDAIGAQEILMPALTPKGNWEVTGRWSSFDALFKITGSDSREYALAASHEEIVVPLVAQHSFSYKDLPVSVYQIQGKFRNEKRAKNGMLRGREFIMKDMYSFHADEADVDRFYKEMQKVYFKIFERCGLLDMTYLTFAKGGTFAKYSHEFQVVSEAGEDDIYICDNCSLALNQEIMDELKRACPNCGATNLRLQKAIEVGNIFKLKDAFSAPFGYEYSDETGRKKSVLMGCYGIGLGRLMGTVAEVCHDERGLVWPKEIAPYTVHLLQVNSTDAQENNKIKLTAEKLYKDLQKSSIEVLFDDRSEASTGEKFAAADLIGCPLRLVVSERSLNNDSVEVKKRNEDAKDLIKLKDVVKNSA